MIDQIIRAIEDSEQNGLHEQLPQGILEGYSGEKIVGLMQRLVELYSADKNICYLEVGVFQGLTLLSVAAANLHTSCYGIDNFAFFDPQGRNKDIIEQRKLKLKLSNAFLIEQDYEDALENLSEYVGQKKIGVFFIDGPHDYRSQLMCLELVLPYLNDHAVIIIDDSNYRHVRQANRDFLQTHPEFKLVLEAYTGSHPINMQPEQQEQSRKGWWNGINVIVHDPHGRLTAVYPPTERNRLLFENDHLIHAHRLAEYATNSLAILDSFTKFRILKTLKSLIINAFKIRKLKAEYSNRFLNGNTYSAGLTAFNLNRKRD